jgi:hypothetical protein
MPDPNRNPEAARLPTRWPVRTDIPHSPNIVVVFHGLMCFCHNGADFCQIGIHNNAPHHKFKINLYEVAGRFDIPYDPRLGATTLVESYDKGDTGGSDKHFVRLDVLDSGVTDVGYYQIEPPKSDAHDFRHIVDLEGPGLHHGEKLRKRPTHMGPRIHINQGVFYTLCRTRRQFKTVSGEEVNRIGSVAQFVACNIYLEGEGYFSIQMKGKEVKKLESDKKYLITVSNGCPQNDPACVFVPDHPDKTKRNDFHHYYDTFERPGGKEYELFRDTDSPLNPSCSDDFLGDIKRVFEQDSGPRATDDAPCGAAGFGVSSGLS